MFLFIKELCYNEIINGIKVRSYEKQITKFNCHGFGKCKRITPKNNHPQEINPYPKKRMIKEYFSLQYYVLSKVITTFLF